jgi:endo-1,4-beta-xylanase
MSAAYTPKTEVSRTEVGEGVGATLAGVARDRNMRFGSEVHGPIGNDPSSFDDARYRALLIEHCDVIVPGVEMKWHQTARNGCPEDYAPLDRIVCFARSKGKMLRGHAIVWQRAIREPEWLRNGLFQQCGGDARFVLDRRIESLCERYGDVFYSFDVVNEAVDPKTGALIETKMSQALGGCLSLLEHSFRATRAGAPRAQLVYNDYMDWTSASEKHREGVLRLLRHFRDKGVPVDALGIQSHISAGVRAVLPEHLSRTVAEWRRFVDQVAGMGYDIAITELDVEDAGLTGPSDERLGRVAEVVGQYLDATLHAGNVSDVIVWGLVDRYSWLRTWRRDHLTSSPCLFSDTYEKKPAYAAIARAISDAPPFRPR